MRKYIALFVCCASLFDASTVQSTERALPIGPCNVATPIALDAAQKCKEFAIAGNADAMFQLGWMLLTIASNSVSTDEAANWRLLGDRQAAVKWIEDAGNKGSDQAIKYLCSLGSDPNATPGQRAESKVWCEQL